MAEQGNKKPVLLALTGITATIVLILAYRKYSQTAASTASTLHRSNAIRRPRRRWRAGHTPQELSRNPLETAIENLRVRIQERRPYGQYANNAMFVATDEALEAGQFDLLPDNIPQIFESLRQLQPLTERQLHFFKLHITCAFVENFLQQEFPKGWILGDDVDTLIQELGTYGVEETAVTIATSMFDVGAVSQPGWDPDMVREEQVDPPIAVSQPDRQVDRPSAQQAIEALSGPAPDDESESSSVEDDVSDPGGSQNMLDLLYHIAGEQAKREGFVHRNVRCNSCGMYPIQGIRFQCVNCYDYDLCEDCEAQQVHNKNHIFYKIRIPAPPRSHIKQPVPVLYPGLPNAFPTSMPRELQRRLIEQTGMDKTEMEASYEQFKCLAGEQIHPESDPARLGVAISRRNFNMYFTPNSADRPPNPNLIYDRIFAYYDFHNDGVITLDEYVIGVWALTNKSRGARLRRMFRGYDLDGDGFVDRRDFLRILRAYYAISREVITEMISLQDELDEDIRDVVNGSQPISAAFSAPNFAGHASRAGQDKELDSDGDLVVSTGPIGVLDQDTEMRGDRARAIGNRAVRSNGRASRMRSGQRRSDADEPLLSPPSPYAALADSSSLASDYLDHDFLLNSSPDLHVYGWPPHQIPGDEDIFNALGADLPLDEITDPIDRSRIIHAQMQRLDTESDRRLDAQRATAVQEFWRRRRFYLDEEEGLTKPPGYTETDSSDEAASIDEESDVVGQTSTNSRRQSMRSRSSSKVRFDDSAIDTDHETRSNASSRSIPINERWGGFEISGPERDIGKEIMYQAIQQGFNELLDPIFKPGEDEAMEAINTKGFRTQWSKELDEFEANFEKKAAERAEAIRQADLLRSQALTSNRVDGITEEHTELGLANLPPIAHEAEETDHIQIMFGNSPRKPQDTVTTSMATITESTEGPASYQLRPATPTRDPTLPHNKPNDSNTEMSTKTLGEGAKPHSEPRPATMTDDSDCLPCEADLFTWSKHRKVEKQADERGGYGKLSYLEFCRIVIKVADSMNVPLIHRRFHESEPVSIIDDTRTGTGSATGVARSHTTQNEDTDEQLDEAWSSTASLGRLSFLDTWLEMAQF